MIEIAKDDLKVMAQACDVNNLKLELNYLYVDEKHIVSTNTRVLAMFEHEGGTEPFYVDGNVVLHALKTKGAVSFVLMPGTVTCLNKEGVPILNVSKVEETERFKYPDYQKIIPEKMHREVKFFNRREIEGVLLFNQVVVDNKYIPDIGSGTIGMNASDMPILIERADDRMKVVVMPITDLLPPVDFRSEKKWTEGKNDGT